MKPTAETVEAFSGVYLSPRYDRPQPTPDFHRECWRRYCSDALAAATAAPRGHAKSTALTHDYVLAVVLFREEQYVVLIGASEEMAIEHLGDIANELRENDDLIRDFKIKGFVTDQKTDVIVECQDGYQFRIIARGAEQKIRGKKWRGKRPGLIVGDDLEDDEQVESKERRRKFRRWFLRAAKQALRDGGKIRVHGTVLHDDSLLMHLVRNKEWASRLYKAQRSFDDFSDILWPEKFPENRLRSIRQEFINEGDAPGFSQEYLNDPQDNTDAYIRKEDMLEMAEEDYDTSKIIGVGVDFAISKQDHANRTSFTVGGKDANNIVCVIDQRVARQDILEIVEEFFSVQEAWSPDTIWVEDGQIWLAVSTVLYKEMQKRNIWLNCVPLKPVKDKAVRGRAFQKRTRARAMRFDKRASWYAEYEYEILRFTGVTEATLDDQFDSTATLMMGFEKAAEVEVDDFKTEEEEDFDHVSYALRSKHDGRSQVTGY